MTVAFTLLRALASLLCAAAGLLLLEVAVLVAGSLFVDPRKDYGQDSPVYRLLLNAATASMCVLLRIRVHVGGRNLVPQDGSFLLVCNHRSKFDPVLTWLVLARTKVVFITKPENLKVPVFGRIVHRLRFIRIDRESIGTAAAAFRRGTELLKEENICVAVYPEGTRSPDCKLLPFHAVVFSMASHARVPVLVLTVRGTEQIRRNYPWRHSDVYFDFVECIPRDWVSQHRTRELCARAESGIRTALEAGGRGPAQA